MKTTVLYRVAIATLTAAALAACQPNYLAEDKTPKPTASGRMSAE